MKTKIYLNSVLAAAMAFTLAACDENAWNDHLNGFEDENNKDISNTLNVEYTLTDADYASIASNATNKALAGDEYANALAAVANRKAFSDAIPASTYVPAFLSSTSFPYFTATDGSSVKLTYNVSHDLPAYLDEAAAAQMYTITEDDYMNVVWESDEDYIEGFAPSHPASRFIPKVLAQSLDASDGNYAVVSYKASAQEPVFGNTEKPEEPGFKLSETIGSAVKGAPISCSAVVTAICAQGYIVTDNSGSILVYMGGAFDASSVQIGQQLEIEGTIGAYNTGLQVVGNKDDVAISVNVVGEQAVTYPAPKDMTGAELDQAITRTTDALAQYVRIKGKAVVTERNINILVDGAATAQGSVYQGTAAQKALFTNDAEVTVEGYFIAIAAGRYYNMVITSVNGAPAKAARHSAVKTASVPLTSYNAVYECKDGQWSVPANFTILNPEDYTAMGQSHPNLAKPELYLPAYLRSKFPYAQAGDIKNVMYLFYNSSTKETSYACDQYVCNGTEWTINNGIETETAQFVRSEGKWMYDPCVTITLPAGKGVEISTKYYQACVDWVFNNICKPLGQTELKSGEFYISTYGNNEYYSGTSAYQGNVDHRPSAARGQYPAEYNDMTDEQIIALEKERFMNEVMPGALSMLHGDAKPVPGIEVIYIVNFYVYNGSATNPYTARFKVVAPGKFEPIDCTWDAE